MAIRRGDDGPDSLVGTNRADSLFGLGGKDRLEGGGGADAFFGGTGDDRLFGGAGADLFHWDAGADSFYGGAGTDRVSYADADQGASIFVAWNGGLPSSGAAEDDVFVSIEQIVGTGFDDTMLSTYALAGQRGVDFFGGAGDDRLATYLGNNRLDGGAGNDDVSGGDGDDLLKGGTGNDRVYGGEGQDKTIGGGGGDTLSGDGGNDVVQGGGGTDTLYGGDGDDRLVGGGGADRMSGGPGTDVLRGGAGADVFVITPFGDRDTITDFNGGAGDQAEISGSNYTSLRQMRTAGALEDDADGNTVMHFSAFDSTTFLGVSADDLREAWFYFG